VEIYSANWSHYYGTEPTIPEYRKNHEGRTELKFAERPHNQPEALVAWFYPGRVIGHEFIYPQKVEKRVNRDHEQKIFIPTLKVRSAAS
jgi:hypothetical protein